MLHRFLLLMTSLCSLSNGHCQSAISDKAVISRKLAPVDLQDLDPQVFTDAEIDMPYYLAHFHQLANAVVLEGPHRGFIDIPVWRRERDNRPYNARIMENILSLAFFYANDRPWNPFYGSSQLRHRLEAALSFWCDIQSPDGAFSEYGPQKWNLAASAFATKFMGESLHWLHRGVDIDSALLQRVVDADRKAIHHILTDSAFYAFGQRYSNQYSNVWAGALAFLDLYPDDEIQRLLLHRLQQSMTSFQSPAGYFYEANGPDWSYNLGTHHSNLHMAFHYAKDSKIKEMLAEKERAFSVWLSYNCVPEPESGEFILNRGIECRQFRPSFERYGWLLSQGMPLAKIDPFSHAFIINQEEVQNEIKEIRAQMIQDWPKVDSLTVGEFRAFSPYAFLYRNHERYYPTEEERQLAMKALPINQPPFVHQRYDVRNETVYTFIKTPSYYAVFNSGKKVRDQQRFGLGLLASTEIGSILQTQTGQNHGAWGTRLHADSIPIEGGNLMAQFFMDDDKIDLQPGNRDLTGTVLRVEYELPDNGTKKLFFMSDRIRVEINADVSIAEHLPLLVAPGTVPRSDHGIIMLLGASVMVLNSQAVPQFEEPLDLTVSKKLCLAQLQGDGQLVYEVIFTE